MHRNIFWKKDVEQKPEYFLLEIEKAAKYSALLNGNISIGSFFIQADTDEFVRGDLRKVALLLLFT